MVFGDVGAGLDVDEVLEFCVEAFLHLVLDTDDWVVHVLLGEDEGGGFWWGTGGLQGGGLLRSCGGLGGLRDERARLWGGLRGGNDELLGVRLDC